MVQILQQKLSKISKHKLRHADLKLKKEKSKKTFSKGLS